MKTTTAIRERVAVRAYLAWLNGSTAGAEIDWHEAEQIEQAYAERRAAAARKAADTRRAKSAIKAPAEMLVAVKRLAGERRPIAH